MSLAHAEFRELKVNQIKTPSGLIAQKTDSPATCALSECKKIVIDDMVLAKAWAAKLLAVLPSLVNPELIAYTTHGGGNCCLPTIHIVDVSAPKLIPAGDLFLETDNHLLAVVRRGDQFEINGDALDRTKLSDSVATTYVYDRKQKLVWVKPAKGLPSFIEFLGKHPEDLLGDAGRRTQLVNVVGADSFADYRRHMSVASGMELVDPRWLVGKGCLPHSCESSESFLAVDLLYGHLIAIKYDTEYLNSKVSRAKVAIWSQVPSEESAHEVRDRINQWLPEGVRLRSDLGKLCVSNASNPQNDGSQ